MNKNVEVLLKEAECLQEHYFWGKSVTQFGTWWWCWDPQVPMSSRPRGRARKSQSGNVWKRPQVLPLLHLLVSVVTWHSDSHLLSSLCRSPAFPARLPPGIQPPTPQAAPSSSPCPCEAHRRRCGNVALKEKELNPRCAERRECEAAEIRSWQHFYAFFPDGGGRG